MKRLFVHFRPYWLQVISLCSLLMFGAIAQASMAPVYCHQLASQDGVMVHNAQDYSILCSGTPSEEAAKARVYCHKKAHSVGLPVYNSLDFAVLCSGVDSIKIADEVISCVQYAKEQRIYVHTSADYAILCGPKGAQLINN